MANSIIGRKLSIGPCFTSMIDAPMPFWNTPTSAPYAAPIDSRFMITAFNGTSSDRNTTNSRRNDSSSTTPMKSGRRAST